jgi:ribosomal protein uL24
MRCGEGDMRVPEKFVAVLQGREGKVVQVYRKKWVIHIERITREKVNGAHLLSSCVPRTARTEHGMVTCSMS